mgnify:FL=1
MDKSYVPPFEKYVKFGVGVGFCLYLRRYRK